MTTKVIAAVAALLLGACTAGAPLSVPLAAAPSGRLMVRSVHADDKGDAVLVHGVVRRATLDRGPLWGHLHVEARFADGRTPVKAGTRWIGAAPRGARLGRYTATLPIADATSVAGITVSYVSGAHADEAPSGPDA